MRESNLLYTQDYGGGKPWQLLWNHCPCWAVGRSTLTFLEGGIQQGWTWEGQELKAGGHVEKGFRVLGGDLNPRPSLFFASVLSFVPCASLIGLELACVCWEGRLNKGRGLVRGGPQGEGLSCSVCFLSPLSLSQIHLSLSSLCPASPVCPSVCLWGGRGKKVPCPRPWASFSLRSPECDLCLILPLCFLVLASFQANPQPLRHVCPGHASLRRRLGPSTYP